MLNELRVGEFLAALGERTPAPASGAATALAGALAAALTELAARFAEDDDAVVRAKAATMRLLELADEDAAAYTAFMADRNEETRARIVAVPEEIAARADEVAELAQAVRAQLRPASRATRRRQSSSPRDARAWLASLQQLNRPARRRARAALEHGAWPSSKATSAFGGSRR